MHLAKACLRLLAVSVLIFANNAIAQISWDAQARLCADYTGQRALDACQQALTYAPEDYPDAARAEIYLDMGIALGELNRNSEALYALQNAVKLDPENAKIRYNLGVALDALGHHWKALLEYRKAVKIDPNYTIAWGNRGVDAFNTERYEEARTSFETAIDLDPSYFDSRPAQEKMYGKSIEIAPKSVAYRREVSARFSPNIGYFLNVGDQLNVNKFMYLLFDGGVDVQIWQAWFATANFFYGHTKWQNNMQGNGMNIYAPTFGVKYVLREDQWTRPKDTVLDKSRYWFSLSVGPYITDLSGAANSIPFSAGTKEVDVGANAAAGVEYYFVPNVGAGLQVKLHFVNFDENYFIVTGGPSIIGRF